MRVTSAGEWIAVEAAPVWAGRLIARALGRRPVPDSGAGATADDGRASVRLQVESGSAPFGRAGLRPVTRGAYSDGQRTLLLDAGGSGFDLLLTVDDELLSVTARYRPATRTRAANRLLPDRFALLAGQVLVHYPVLWRAGWRGRVPLHASVVRTSHGTPLLAGPGGVGKSTILLGLLAEGASATADNVCAADERRCYGLAEPLRTDAAAAGVDARNGDASSGGGSAGAGTGDGARRTSHGRIERSMPRRVPVLTPDRLVLLERGPRTEIRPAKPDDLGRALVAGTYAAGELRRYWAFAATLALATGRGPAHPPVTEVAGEYCGRLPCLRVRVGDRATVTAEQLCGEERGGGERPVGEER